MSKTNKNEPFGSSLEVSTVALGGCGQVPYFKDYIIIT
jgi:hypothetical protein